MNKIKYDNTGDSLFSVETVEDDVAVTCLGIEFKNDKERKEYFLNLLAEKLKDPDFRKIEGFPIGTDEDILALSDPPYYCACPNPWLNNFIKEWEAEKPAKPVDWVYKREPFAADVSEGKSDPIYNVHTYHTKVPPKAIMQYILHYTDPGDIVFDGFCGTGMTGVAALLCEDSFLVSTYKEKIVNATKGNRHTIMNDLSPIAGNIAYNLNAPHNAVKFRDEVEKILKSVKEEFGWVYKTKHVNGFDGEINYTVWSDVFVCPNCGEEIVFYDAAMDKNNPGKVNDSFCCPHCETNLTKRKLDRAKEFCYDKALNTTVLTAKTKPVLINYSIDGKQYEKKPDADDLNVIAKIENMEIATWFPIDELPKGYNTEQPKKSHGLTNVHQFYHRRTLLLLSAIYSKLDSPTLLFWFTSQLINLSKMNRYRPGVSFPYNPLNGTLYIGSLVSESSVFTAYQSKAKKISKTSFYNGRNIIGINSSTQEVIESNSIDYIFIDPPFGANINYSELSFIWESWIKVKTSAANEAIENFAQAKGIFEYSNLMLSCFQEFYRILKPGHWMTVEFSNTNQAVWNSIQSNLSSSGFIIANVSALDKQMGSFKAVTTTTAVKQDLIISAYKPDETFAQQISGANGISEVWNFIRKHLEYLPVVKEVGTEFKNYLTVPDRDPRILYDRLVSYYVGHNILLPISSPEFISELDKYFIERDGLYYLPEQVACYDKLKAQGKIGDEDTTGSLFVQDESSAIAWIREQLKKKTMTTGEMTPLFMQELSSWNKNEKRLELAEILEENFLKYDGIGDVPSPIHSYLSTNFKELRNMDKDNPALIAKAKGRWYVPDPNKQADLEKLREKGLLREFNGYLQTKGKLKEFRLEAVRAGFKKAWSDKDYKLIIDFAARIPSAVIKEDQKLFMWYKNAVTRSER